MFSLHGLITLVCIVAGFASGRLLADAMIGASPYSMGEFVFDVIVVLFVWVGIARK